MPLTTILKQLRLKMASMQSPRTQCCCCAVGVFAAMFGIFMLSAGICIVLNVTFMEVDTSGLPPELHNENGKKVVGIILICVSIGALGLSATVSVLYFTLCSRKATPATTANAAASQQNQNGHHVQGARANHNGGHGHRMSGIPGAAPDRPGSRDSITSASQTSLKSLKNSRRSNSQSSIDGVQFSRSMLTPGPGSRNHTGAYSRGYKKRKPHHHIRPGRFRGSGLEPHKEEDLEPATPGMDLNNLQRSCDSLDKEEKLEDRGAAASSASATGISPSKRTPPAIVIDQTPQETFTPMSTVSSGDYYMETPFMDTTGNSYDEDPLSNTYDESSIAAAMAAERQYPSQLNDTSTLDSASFTNEFNTHDQTISQQPAVFTIDSRENSDLIGSLSSSSSQQTNNIERNLDRASSPPQSSSSNRKFQHSIVNVQPPKGAELSTPVSSSNTLDMLDQYEEEVERHDGLSDLPPVNQHQYVTNLRSETTDQDSRCESQASYNSGFSYDGDDPDKTDMERLTERMEKLL